MSYRREDSSGHAGRLHADLARRFGSDHVFFDIRDIPPGEDFVDVIDREVAGCDVLLVVIGKLWLDCAADNGTRRLDNPLDFVRLEICAALKRKILVIPLLVQDAIMPGESELPGGMENLARRNALEVSDARWDYDVGRLADFLVKKKMGPKDRSEADVHREVGSPTALASDLLRTVKSKIEPRGTPELITDQQESGRGCGRFAKRFIVILLVAIFLIVVVGLFGDKIKSLFSTSTTKLNGVPSRINSR